MALILKKIWSDRNLALHNSSTITCHLPSMPFTEDAAISTSHACLAAVTRDHHGVPIKILARITKVASPLLAESEALLWAVQLAIREGWNHVIFEGDAKSCFDAVNSCELP
uniref:RNase H type-1 domain-containing protein n=1 Tax=Quercus lobata TaxID=97700 RepID=A0A7N2R3H6_QUELO